MGNVCHCFKWFSFTWRPSTNGTANTRAQHSRARGSKGQREGKESRGQGRRDKRTVETRVYVWLYLPWYPNFNLTIIWKAGTSLVFHKPTINVIYSYLIYWLKIKRKCKNYVDVVPNSLEQTLFLWAYVYYSPIPIIKEVAGAINLYIRPYHPFNNNYCEGISHILHAWDKGLSPRLIMSQDMNYPVDSSYHPHDRQSGWRTSSRSIFRCAHMRQFQ